MIHQLNKSFLKEKAFSLSIHDAILFIVLGTIVWVMNMLAHITFPFQSFVPYLVRTGTSAVGTFIMLYVSVRLLKRTNVPANSLGLKLSRKSFAGFISGLVLGAIAILVAGSILYIFVPYHFEAGPLKTADVIREAHAYFWGNFLEELLFRGYLLIILSQLLGWRIAVCILALPFGLFHLPGLGFSMEGLKMIITTATFSFVFCYSFILTGTLWTAIGVHVTANVLLHAVLGLDGSGKGMFIPVFETHWPVNYDPGFLSVEAAAIILSLLLYFFINRPR
jgi:membrane protease YdiL (CAAX protease family)